MKKHEINIDEIGATYFSGELAKVGTPEPESKRAAKPTPPATDAPYTDSVDSIRIQYPYTDNGGGARVRIAAPERAETRSKRFELKLTPSMFTALQATAESCGASMNEVIIQMINHCLYKGGQRP